MHWLGLLFVQLGVAGDCPDFERLGTDPAAAAERLAEAEDLYVEIYAQVEDFRSLSPWVIDGVSCLESPATPQLAARYHRFRALSTDPLGGLAPTVREQASASLAAASRLQPGHTSTLPDDHGHRQTPATQPRVELVAAPSAGTLFFDGREGLERPVGSSTFFQRTGEDGAVVDSAYLYPTDAMPAYPTPPVREPEAIGTTEPARLAPSRRRPLRLAGAGLGVAALGLLAGNQLAMSAALGEDSDRDRATRAMPVVNTLAVGAWVTGAGSLGLLTSSLVVK